MKNCIKILFYFSLLLYSALAFSQEKDSLVSNNLIYDSILSSDANSLNVLFYKQKNDVLLNNLGPFGSPSYATTAFELNTNKRFYLNDIRLSIINIEGLKPFTNISYINASRKEQLISISHLQKFGKLISFSFDFTKLSSPGIYINQEVNNTMFDAVFDYANAKGSYELHFSSFINRSFFDENGGLLNPIDFENNLYSNRRSYNVNLNYSQSSNKNYIYNLNHKLKLFSFASDTIEENTLSLQLKTRYKSNNHVFNDDDPLSSFYQSIIYDSLATVDSIFNRSISNSLGLYYLMNDWTIGVFSGYDVVNYSQLYGIDTSYQDISTGIFIEKASSTFSLNLIGDYVLSGYASGDINLSFFAEYHFSKNSVLSLNSSYHLNEADLKYVDYYSNHFAWKNYSLQKQSAFSNQLKVEFRKIKTAASVENQLITDFIYLNSDVSVVQDNSLHSISTFKVEKDYHLLNFHFRTALFYQLTSNEILFPMPELMGRQLLYYENYLFKKALKFQIGGNITFKTDYYAYGYMPAINEFHTQSSSLLGSYPYLDIFINTKLKRAQIFFKYEHFNAGWSDNSFYASPNYPRLDKSFKFGVSWNMFD